MFESLKRLFGVRRKGAAGQVLEAWAQTRGFSVKSVREEAGLVVEGALDGGPWRLEWGAPQREYIAGRELRLRMDLGLPRQLQMAVMTRALAEDLEQSAYALFTQDTRTLVDSGMPEEMRWLAMFPKAQTAALRPLDSRFVAVSMRPESLDAWIVPPLVRQLAAAAERWLTEGQPLVLLVLRGRVYVRTQALDPDRDMLDGLLSLLGAAVQGARAAAATVTAEPPNEAVQGSTDWGSLPPHP